MDSDRVARFWKRRASESRSTRWTSAAQLVQDRSIVDPYRDASTVLDLGAGTGELLAGFVGRASHVTAVDMIPEFLDRIEDFPGLERVSCRLEHFKPVLSYDVILMFGVVTCIDVATEEAILGLCSRALTPTGTMIIKHQCSDAEAFEVDRAPDGTDDIGYVGRYPSIVEQVQRLEKYFTRVATVHYPEELRRHANSHDCAFICER